jgi:hypothetical protein
MANSRKSTPKKSTPKRAAAKSPNKSTKAEASRAATSNSVLAKLPKLFATRLAKILTTVFVVLLVIVLGAVYWMTQIYNNPEAVFWDSINNSLSTRGVTKITAQKSNTFTTDESIQMGFTPVPVVHDVKKISDTSTSPTTHINLEAIGTTTADYQHYLLIERPSASDKPEPDYKKIYSMWLKSTSPQIVTSSLFGPILFGNLQQPQRSTVMNSLKKSYNPNISSVRKTTYNGRKAYVYNVQVQLHDYAQAAKDYANSLGLDIGGQIDPANYSTGSKTSIELTVDALSQQIKEINYASNGTKETYSGYGVLFTAQPPKKTVSSDEFQKAINSIP